MIKIFIVDDHPIVRKGLVQIVAENKDMQVIEQAASAEEMFEKLKTIKPQIIVLDISMPGINGYDALGKLKIKYPNIDIIMLSALSEDTYAMQCIKAGALGFISKEAAPEELPKALRKVASGRAYISSSFAEKLVLNIGNNNKSYPHEKLSEREFQVMIQIGSGSSPKEIAEILNLSPKTISTYRSRILEKLNLNSTAEIIKYSINNKLL